MGEPVDTIRPVWRTPLAAALLAWMGLVVGTTLASSRLLELVPASGLPFLAIGLYIAPIPVLLVWSFWAMLREPVSGWLAPTIVLAFCGGFIPAFRPLFDVGVSLNFAAHRPAYEAIVADIGEGGDPAQRGWIEGRRGDVRYGFQGDHRELIQFTWSDNTYLPSGVVYDARSCGVPRSAQRRRIISTYDRHLGGHYCYVRDFL
jgi:hypothetical protein